MGVGKGALIAGQAFGVEATAGAGDGNGEGCGAPMDDPRWGEAVANVFGVGGEVGGAFVVQDGLRKAS